MSLTALGTGVDAYDHALEATRLSYPDVVVGGKTLNRGTAVVSLTKPVESAETAAARAAQNARLFTTTLSTDSPVVELGWPVAGPFAMGPAGVVFDGYLGVAQKLLDEHHPRFLRMIEDLRAADVLLRREIATDDYL